MKRSIGVTRVCGQLRQLAEARDAICRPRQPARPTALALRLQRQRLDGTDAEHGLAQGRLLLRLCRDRHGRRSRASGLRNTQNDHRDHGTRKPSRSRPASRSARTGTAAARSSVIRSRNVVSSWPVRNSRTLMDLADPVHRFAGRMPLEVIERQPQQAIEHVQIQLEHRCGCRRPARSGGAHSRATSRKRSRCRRCADSSASVE